MRRLAIACLALVACAGGEHREARETYDDGVTKLVAGDYEAAEKALLDARSAAGVDPELRFDAAYDLGMAYAAQADKAKAGKDADLAKALEDEQEAVSWFSDALRLRKDDADTIANLAIVRARAQAIADDLAAGANKLEARLDAVIGDQRAVLDDGRAAWSAVREAGGRDPLAGQAQLTKLADRERGIVAEVGTIGDLASDEIDQIAKKKEEQREPKEKARMVQLKNLDLYLLDARARIAEGRRKFQDLAADDGVARAEAALAALKRAREQLLDPLAVIGEIAQEEAAEYEGGLARAPDGAIAGLGGGSARVGRDAAPTPSWLAPAALADRQGGLRDRLEEVRARLAAATEHAQEAAAGSASGSGARAPASPEEAKLLERIAAALPFLVTASTDMDHARVALAADKQPDALAAQADALTALARAIEEFADLKKAVELAYQTHEQTLGYLGPEAAQAMPAAERARRTHEALTGNRARLDRIAALIAEQRAQAEAAGSASGSGAPPQEQVDGSGSAAAGSAAGGQRGSIDGSGSAAAGSAAGGQRGSIDGSGSAAAGSAAAAGGQRGSIAAAKAQLAHAEELRAGAAADLAKLDDALAKNADPLPPAHDAEAKLKELREVFFSVIEHLQQLIVDQRETRDRTAAEVVEDDATRAPKLPAIEGREDQHLAMAKAIADALAKQADQATKAAGAQPQTGPTKPQSGPDPKALAAAAEEVRKAQPEMTTARGAIDKVVKTTNASVPLQPAVESEDRAIEHLVAALKLLQPPQNDQNQDKNQKDQKQDQKNQKQDPKDPQKKNDPKDAQRQPAPQGGAGQRARDDDARRQRERRERGSGADAVEKDW